MEFKNFSQSLTKSNAMLQMSSFPTIAYGTSMVIYSVASIIALVLITKELQLRKHIKIISFGGHVTNSQPTNSDSNEAFLFRSFHYLSIFIYILSFFSCFVGIFRGIPRLCIYGIPNVSFAACVILSKLSIVIFQCYRYYVCFISKQHIKFSESMHLRWLIGAIIFAIMFLAGAIYTTIDISNSSDIHGGLWCFMDTRQGIWISLAAIMFLWLDWYVIIMYIVGIVNISRKITYNDHTYGRGKNGKQKQGVIKKLSRILVRILICALIMEFFFIISILVVAFANYFVRDLFVLGALFGTIDAITNIILTSMMLEHHTKEYETFVRWLIPHLKCCFCSCMCCTCCNMSIDNVIFSTEKVDQSKHGNVNKKCDVNDTIAKEAGIKNTKTTDPSELHTEINIHHHSTGSNFNVESVHFVSQVSRDDRISYAD